MSRFLRFALVTFLLTTLLLSPSCGSYGIVDGNGNGNGNGTYPPLPPDTIQRVNKGVGTILRGVRYFSLEQILRGSFMFTRNENVRSVANNVLDQVFFLRHLRRIPGANEDQQQQPRPTSTTRV